MRHQRARFLTLGSRIAVARGDRGAGVNNAAAAQRLDDAQDIRPDVFLRSTVMMNDAEARCIQSPSAEAAASLEQAMETRLSITRPGSPLIVDAQLQAARCSLALGQVAHAKELLAKAERGLESAKSLGPQYSASLQFIKASIP